MCLNGHAKYSPYFSHSSVVFGQVPRNITETDVTTPTVQTPIKTTTPTVPITTTTPNAATPSQDQRPVTDENLKTTPSLDPRLLVNTVLTKRTFTNILREYSFNEPTNAVTKFTINNSLRPRIQYRTEQSRPFVPITGNSLTPINVTNNSLAGLVSSA